MTNHDVIEKWAIGRFCGKGVYAKAASIITLRTYNPEAGARIAQPRGKSPVNVTGPGNITIDARKGAKEGEKKTKMIENEITRILFDAAYFIHRST
jgi:hypothetical protein